MGQMMQRWLAQQLLAQQGTTVDPAASSVNNQTKPGHVMGGKAQAATMSDKNLQLFADTVRLAKLADPDNDAKIEQQYQQFLQEVKRVNDLSRLVQLHELCCALIVVVCVFVMCTIVTVTRA
jgi:aminopeptidase N